MKKILLSSVIALIFLLTIYFSFENTTNYSSKLPFNNDKFLIAIFDNENIVKKYYSNKELNKVKNIVISGINKFLIIPRYKGMEIEIYKQELKEEGEMKETLVEKVSEPFYLECNVSDLYSNAAIKIKYKDKTYNYSPYYSLKDGSLMLENFVMYLK